MNFDEYLNKGIDAFNCEEYEIAAAIFLGYILSKKDSPTIDIPPTLTMPYSNPYGVTTTFYNNNGDPVEVKYSNHT